MTIEVTAGAVPMAGGTAGVDSLEPFRINGPLLTMPSGARIAGHPTGALTDRRIALLSQERAGSSVLKVIRSGANRCSEPSCELVSMADAVLFPLEPSWAGATDAPQLPAIFLGSWLLSSDDGSISEGSSAGGASSNAGGEGNRRPSGINFARILRRISAPEAAIPALVALGVGGLVLSARKLRSR
ncbi:MAG: hypothetical protein WEF50_14125 [Myxococcota bacterium]